MSVPETPQTPTIVSSVQTGLATASATIAWQAVIQTGGVPLTGYKVYATLVSTGIQTLLYDGTNHPEILSTTLTNLVLDQDYEIYLTALNPLESDQSAPLTIRAAGLPFAPGAITEVPLSRTGSSIGL